MQFEFDPQVQPKKRKSPIAFFALLLCVLLCLLWLLLRMDHTLAVDRAAGEAMLASKETPYVAAAITEPKKEESVIQDEAPKAIYQSPEGIQFISHSAAWNEENLSALYQELLQNRHGAELTTLSEVIVYAESDESASATHQSVLQQNNLYLKHAMFPPDFHITFSENADVITLFDGDNRTTPAQMAWSLSHEYGHLYTFYYMFHGAYDRDTLLSSEYADLRGLNADRLLFDMEDTDTYNAQHLWYLIEIAADDYATLMGSPNSRKWEVSYDIADYLYRGEENSDAPLQATGQENLYIPSAWQVTGLATYFYGLIDAKPPAEAATDTFSLDISSQSRSFSLAEGYRTFTSYRITWEKQYGEDAVYSLLAFDSGSDLSTKYHIRTVTAGTAAEAYIGEVAAESGFNVSYVSDEIAQGNKTFIVKALLPDGRVVYSKSLDKTF